MFTEDDILYLEEANMMLTRSNTGFFEPIATEVSESTGEGIEIKRGSFYHDFIMFIRFSERKKITSGKDFGKWKDGFLDLFQYIFAFKALKMMERRNAEKLIGVFSRQS